MGSLYRRKLKSGKPSTIWWVKYYANGRPIRESTGTEKRKEAERFLKDREGRAAAGQPILARADRVQYDEVAQNLRQHYQSHGTRDLVEAECRFTHLDAFFANRRVASIVPDDLDRYVLKRQRQGAANGTINRELEVLGRMLRLAYENGKLLRLPIVRKLKQNGPRQGFFEEEQFRQVYRHLPPDLQTAISVAYTFGWRMQSEVLMLERRQLDLEADTIRLEPGTTKNDDGRVVYIPADLKPLLATQLERVRTLERRMGRIIPYLFPHLRGRHLGRRVKDFVKRWRTACRKAGVPGMLRHDFRRTAVRNMVNAGVPERVAMAITGHKTRSVFDRYHIVSPADLKQAAERVTGTFPGTSSKKG